MSPGSRYSQIYIARDKPSEDNQRFRNRLAAYFQTHLARLYDDECCAEFRMVTGADIPRRGVYVFDSVFREAELRDVLDAITTTYDVLVSANSFSGGGPARLWLQFVAQVMDEENVSYEVDSSCVVHYRVDEEFARNREAALAALDRQEFGAVRAAFEDAFRHFDSSRQDTKASVRSMFEALETMAKLIVPDAPRLTKNLCTQKLKDACLEVLQPDATESDVLNQLFFSLGYWVEGVHNYRHGQHSHDEVAPSVESAVLILSSGTAHLRHLASCAAKMALASPSVKARPSQPGN